MKQLLLLFSIAFLSNFNGYSQNLQPLSIREAYDFNVNDTFQYNISLGRNQPYYSTQTVILSKQVDTIKKRVEYSTQVEYYYPAFNSGGFEAQPSYSKAIGRILYYENLDSLVKYKCSTTNIPTPPNYCHDSLVLDYGNRKTVKNEKSLGTLREKTHITAGLGQTLYINDDTYYRETKMTYYNKQGQTWGARSSIFEEQNAACKPLTVREVFDFNINDIFIYRIYEYNFRLGFLDTLFEKRTILQKQAFSADSIVYLIKKESFYKSAANKLIVKMDTLVVRDLDSSAVYKIKTTNPYIFMEDKCATLSNSNRRIYGRALGSDRIVDLCSGYYVGAGLGLYSSYSCNFSPDNKNLIYFKKGTEIWGSLINFPTSLFTPSLPDFKITLYPNPTTDRLTIESETLFDDIKITSLEGKTVYEEKTLNALQHSIKLNNMPNGLYFLELYKGKILRGVKKFVVQN